MLEAFAKVPLKLEPESLCQNLLLFWGFFVKTVPMELHGYFEDTITKRDNTVLINIPGKC